MAFLVFIIRDTSIHRTYLSTSGILVGANTLGATGGIYVVNRLLLTDGIVGAFCLTGSASYTV